MDKIKINLKQGFTLLELLVVVLIIGILASIALPQYEMAVTKAKVASILPIMRRWKDAMYEYKLQHGSYDGLESETGGATLGVNWPSDWTNADGMRDEPCGDNIACFNDFWERCQVSSASVFCKHSERFEIHMYQDDVEDSYDELAGMTTCETYRPEGEKICKALGGKLLFDDGLVSYYKLN